MDTLHSHPAVIGYGELFIEGGRGTPRYTGAKDTPHFELYVADRQKNSRDADESTIDSYLNRLFTPRLGAEATGFKLMYGQSRRYPGIGRYIRRESVSVIHLVRRNLLDIVISMATATATDVFHARREDAVTPTRVKLNAGELPDRLGEYERAMSSMRRIFGQLESYLEVVYEDLADDSRHFDDLFRFLGVDDPAEATGSSLVKLNRRSRHDLVENYDRVQEVLAGTRFEWMLDS